MKEKYDVIIVGTGAAGLFTALNLPKSQRICMITKKTAEESDSFLAQGGICMLRGEEDFEHYFEDTMKAGHYLNDKEAVSLMLRLSNEVIKDLLDYGVDFDRDAEGKLAFTKEGAHSQPRILFHEDVTGKEITSTLLQRVRELENVEIYENTTMIDLISHENTCDGIVISDINQKIQTIYADYVVLACGGIGGLYKNSTNYPHISGEALAIARKHGVVLEHLDYVQIHPTTLFSSRKGRRFLISESVRGEGAILLNANQERFTDELQPRDVVSQAIWKQMEIDHTEHVWLDLRPIGKETILHHFPNIYQHCLDEGYDVLKQPIPVVPAQHYFMGGIKVNLGSKTSMDGLYAVGEISCTGVHGKNRLASNSLLESLVFAKKAAFDIIYAKHPEHVMQSVDLDTYQDVKKLLKNYKVIVRSEIEREKMENE